MRDTKISHFLILDHCAQLKSSNETKEGNVIYFLVIFKLISSLMSRTQFFLRIILSWSDIVRVQDSREKKGKRCHSGIVAPSLCCSGEQFECYTVQARHWLELMLTFSPSKSIQKQMWWQDTQNAPTSAGTMKTASELTRQKQCNELNIEARNFSGDSSGPVDKRSGSTTALVSKILICDKRKTKCIFGIILAPWINVYLC